MWEGRRLFAFTRRGDEQAQAFAPELDATWAGPSDAAPPEALNAAVLFAPVGSLVPEALKHTVRGGVVVCAGIHTTDIPSYPYSLLWGERVVRSVANLTRADARQFLAIAPQVPVQTHVQTYPLREASRAIGDLREGRLRGAAVLVPQDAPRQ